MRAPRSGAIRHRGELSGSGAVSLNATEGRGHGCSFHATFASGSRRCKGGTRRSVGTSLSHDSDKSGEYQDRSTIRSHSARIRDPLRSASTRRDRAADELIDLEKFEMTRGS